MQQKMNCDRMPTYITGLQYPKVQKTNVTHKSNTHLIHLRLLKEKLRFIDQDSISSPPVSTSLSPLSPDTSVTHNLHSCHKEPQLER